MDSSIMPKAHPDPWLDKLRPYATAAVEALDATGCRVVESWLDPREPRDFTILCSVGGRLVALVWDEETGWRRGRFLGGEQGQRTRLADVEHLGAELLPAPAAVPHLRAVPDRPARFRSHQDSDDGFEEALDAMVGRSLVSASG